MRQTQSQMKSNSDDPGQFIEFKTANLIDQELEVENKIITQTSQNNKKIT